MVEINTQKKYKILIIEDETLISSHYKKFLEAKNYIVELAVNANEALEKIYNGQNYDLIITDLNMPNWDGTYVISGIYSQLKNIKIIIISGCVEDSQYINTISNFPNIYAVIKKPADLNELSKIISAALTE